MSAQLVVAYIMQIS